MLPLHKLLATGLCLLLLAGCGVTKPSRFYILTPETDDGTTTVTATVPAVGIGPVTFPAYLDRPEIVHRSGDHQLQYAGVHRWAEPLKVTFTRTLAENLAGLLPTDRTLLYPWPRSARPDYTVSVDVLRFDADATGMVVLVAAWEVVRVEDGSVAGRTRSRYAEPAGAFDYPAIVAAQSRAVARLSRDIAAAMRE
jgi:uncharacterized lipoprotein YmbA